MPEKRVQTARTDANSGFAERWLAQAVRLMSFPATQLAQAENSARQLSADAEYRVLHWAGQLAEHTQLRQAMQHWRQRAGAVLLVLLLLAFAGGVTTAFGVMGSGGQPVNVLWALGALLGVNLVMLMFWLFSLGMTSGSMSAGHLWFWLSARLQSKDAAALTQSFTGLSQRAGATRWWLAVVSHAIWCAALAGAFAGLLIALSLRSYVFVWETTILPASVFNSLVQMLAYLPALAGFPAPDATAVQAAGLLAGDTLAQSDPDRSAWAGWLCGAVLVYGLLPRTLLLLTSIWQTRRRLDRVRLSLHSAEWSALNERLTPPSQVVGITDPAPATTEPGSRNIRQHAGPGQGHAVIAGFELGEQIAWPPSLAGSAQVILEQVSTRQQRQAVLQLLDQTAPRALLLICDSAQTVDRGSLSWLRDATGRVLHVAVWLAGDGSDQRRLVWRQQLQTLGLTHDEVFDGEPDARRWLEAHQ